MEKVIPETLKARPILELEIYSLLTALYSFQRYISGAKITVLTDSRVLYYLFNTKITDSSVKMKRWCLKLLSDYPNIELHFVNSKDNLADFLT